MSKDQSKAGRLRAALKGDELVIAPGVYDMISARIADAMGFSSLYMTGYGVVASSLGIADAGLATYSEMVERVAKLGGETQTPLIADADTGYGGLLNVRRTVRGYEAAGAAGIQIEDQTMPKKCGHTLGRSVIPIEEMVLKIEVALEARQKDDTIIVARTDARTSLGLDEALRRGAAYAKAGADIIFIEAPETLAEIARIPAELGGCGAHLLLNCVYDGRTPDIAAAELKRMGYSIAIYAGMAHKAAAGALQAAYGHLQRHGIQTDMPVPMFPTAEMHKLMGFPDVWEFEARWDRSGRQAAE